MPPATLLSPPVSSPPVSSPPVSSPSHVSSPPVSSTGHVGHVSSPPGTQLLSKPVSSSMPVSSTGHMSSPPGTQLLSKPVSSSMPVSSTGHMSSPLVSSGPPIAYRAACSSSLVSGSVGSLSGKKSEFGNICSNCSTVTNLTLVELSFRYSYSSAMVGGRRSSSSLNSIFQSVSPRPKSKPVKSAP